MGSGHVNGGEGGDDCDKNDDDGRKGGLVVA